MKFENMIDQIINGDCYEIIKNKWYKIAVDRLNNIQANGQQTLFTV